MANDLPIMDQATFRRLLLNVSNNLTTDEFSTMKFMLSDLIPKRRMEELVSATQLFAELEQRDLLSANKLDFLREKLAEVSQGRTNLTSIIDRATGKTDVNSPDVPTVTPSPRPEQPGYQNDVLQKPINYLVKNLGRQWKQMCRNLPGISEADLDSAKERFPSDLQEQTRCVLKIWADRSQADCSKNVLITACRNAELNLYADELEDLK